MSQSERFSTVEQAIKSSIGELNDLCIEYKESQEINFSSISEIFEAIYKSLNKASERNESLNRKCELTLAEIKESEEKISKLFQNNEKVYQETETQVLNRKDTLLDSIDETMKSNILLNKARLPNILYRSLSTVNRNSEKIYAGEIVKGIQVISFDFDKIDEQTADSFWELL